MGRKPVQGSILCTHVHNLYYRENSTRFIQDMFLFYNSCWLPLLIVHRCLLIDWHWCQLHSLLWSHSTCLLLGKMWPLWEMTAELSQHEINHKKKSFSTKLGIDDFFAKAKKPASLNDLLTLHPKSKCCSKFEDGESMCFPAGCLLPFLGDSTEPAH